jgi:hypothetical protein
VLYSYESESGPMNTVKKELSFQQVHIEVARNATDDFNPFHDKNHWQNIRRNPFGGPIVLGFQLESLIEHHIKLHRVAHDEQQILDAHGLRFSNYQFSFASAVTCGQEIAVEIKDSRLKKNSNTTLSNRVCVKSDGKLALVGHKRESQSPLFLEDVNLNFLTGLNHVPDRALLPGQKFFLKRKYMTNSNAKNFLTGSLAEQGDYFDELTDKVQYPEIFPCSLISCALLEKALTEAHDFEQNPMVYLFHKISIDRHHLAYLRSNDTLHILVQRTEPLLADHHYECYGVVGNDRLLFRALIALTPLATILRSSDS